MAGGQKGGNGPLCGQIEINFMHIIDYAIYPLPLKDADLLHEV